MEYEKTENRIFDNHAAYNHYLSIQGMRPSEGVIRPSLYISDMKMKKAFKILTDEEIKLLFKQPKAAILGIRVLREKLDKKLDDLMDWQTFVGLITLLREGNFECARYILKCRYEDVSPYQDEQTLYKIIQSL